MSTDNSSAFKTNAAIYYQHEAFTTGLAKLMGRNAAGASFLSGFARHARVDRFIGYARDAKEFEHFRRHVEAQGSGRQSVWVPHGDLRQLAEAGTLFVYSPGVGKFAWSRRAAGGDAGYGIIGLTHTISSDRVMEDFGELLTAPVQPWDALICTSYAVKRTLQGVLETWGEYLAERLGARHTAPRLQLPVIPLGVDCDAFPSGERAARLRARFRQRHAIRANDVAFMFLGRLSFHAKAHPLPMYLALEAAARRTKRKLVLVLAGYFFNESIRKQFIDGAQLYCPGVRLVHVDARQPEERDAAWAGADVFTSFSDNIQESFGLAPVEAMAAGLPAVVSDWDGYRDTVLPGETALSVPTAMPAPGAGAELAFRYLEGVDNYDVYIGRIGQYTAVDVEAAAQAYCTLIDDPQRRREMGEAGRLRAREAFDWSVIVPRYQALWAELAALRAGAPRGTARAHPLRDDPFRVFRAFPTFAIDADTWVEAAVEAPASTAVHISRMSMNTLGVPFMLDAGEMERLYAALMRGGAAVKELQARAGLPDRRRAALLRSLGWLAKGGIVTLRTA